MILAGALGVIAPSMVKNQIVTPEQKKTSATIGGLVLGGVGLSMINGATKGKRFVWNTSINKTLKNVANKAGEFVKNSPIKNYIGKIAKNIADTNIGGFVASKINAIGIQNPAAKMGGFIQTVANSGAKGVQNIATKIAKTSGRQKLMTAFALGTLALVMAAREHYSKEAGATAQRKDDLKRMDALLGASCESYREDLQEKDDIIAQLQIDNELKDVEIQSNYQVMEKIEKAAQKLGVDKQLAAELLKEEE